MAENVFRQVLRQAAAAGGGGGASSSFGREEKEREREKRRGIDERTERWNSGASRSLLHDPQFTVTSRRDAVCYLPSGIAVHSSLSYSRFSFFEHVATRIPNSKSTNNLSYCDCRNANWFGSISTIQGTTLSTDSTNFQQVSWYTHHLLRIDRIRRIESLRENFHSRRRIQLFVSFRDHG